MEYLVEVDDGDATEAKHVAIDAVVDHWWSVQQVLASTCHWAANNPADVAGLS